jgi:hypothetical protein
MTGTLRNPQLSMAIGTEPWVTAKQRTKQRGETLAGKAMNFLVLAIPATKNFHFFQMDFF